MDDTDVAEASPASDRTATKAVETRQKSPLDKPLSELTEDDIAQVTREDCRRFLKEKGMRRPSWNKSQAIQQVISLKALLETKPHGGDGATFSSPQHKKSQVSSSLPPPPEKDENADDASYQRRDAAAAVGPSAGSPAEIAASVSPRITVEQSRPSAVGQITVFYDGKVNVFDGVPAEKALLIMRLAASRDQFGETSNFPLDLNRLIHPPHVGVVQTMSLRPPHPHPTGHPTPGTIKFSSPCPRQGPELRSPRGFDLDGPTCRKASLQRYLEKRKDRKTFKCKRNLDGTSSSSMDTYLIQKFSCATPNVQQSHSGISSPTHPKPPRTPTRCNSFENQTQNIHFSLDCNVDDVRDI